VKLDPLIVEAIIATVSMTIVGTFIALAFWLITDISPWPFVVLSETAAFGMGIVLLTLASPRQRRP
jgi:hypothetical protein